MNLVHFFILSLTAAYEQEQGDINKRIKILRSELKKETSLRYTADMFLEIVRRYTNVTELTQLMVTELIDHIDIYHAERVNGEISQRVVPHYHCIGAFDVPEWKDIPEIDILVETRKGVAVCYTPEKLAG